ncbi:MAG: magnesium transporter [Gammaproteobacteria bacterium]|nr:magnesium transporter [Gammaproteobacteria bacterium]
MIENEKSQKRLKIFRKKLHTKDYNSARVQLKELHSAEIALLLESLPANERNIAWSMVEPDQGGDVLLEVNDDLRADFIREMQHAELIIATGHLETDDLADILPDLPDSVTTELLQSMDFQDRRRLESVLSYPEDTAGGLMNTDAVTVRPDVSLDVVLRYLRLRGSVPDMTDSLIVVDRDDRYFGLLLITDLLIKLPQQQVADVMMTTSSVIQVTDLDTDVAVMFEHRDLVSAPVVDAAGKLVGRITIDDVVDVIRDEADQSLMNLSGVQEEADVFGPVTVTARRRGIWLGVNLLTVLVASWVIGLFETTIERLVALAVLMPIVASMGGIAGSQTLTIVVRGMALGQIGQSNALKLMSKELCVGLMNGLLWSIVIAAIAVFWFEDHNLGLVIALAIIINLLVGAFAGATIPLVMSRLGADPALGGSVLLTAVTDAVGFFVFLGLASLYLV